VIPTENRLIAALPRRERLRLLALCEPVLLATGDILHRAGKATRYAYFPTGAFVSLVAEADGEPRIEVGMAGTEGMLGAHLALRVNPVALHAVVQGPGPALRVGAAALSAELARSKPLQETLQRYLYVVMAQFAASAACLHCHAIGPRLARWLLMTQDRAHSEEFRVTHQFLAYMLGVRRAGITSAAGALQRHGLIQYRRGAVTVLDRAGLLDAACGCYGKDTRLYRRLFALPATPVARARA
jgi:CRP-like cAMP-binding protein